jgi:hypothetical protein
MLRKMSLFAASMLVVLSCVPGHSQDAPAQSLGDLARQAQAEKEKKHASAARTITNDDMPSSSSIGSLGLGDMGSSKSGSKSGTAASTAASALEELDRAGLILTKLDSMDRATLAKFFLEDADHDFPGRANWERDLFAAKQVYVSRGREVIRESKQLMAEAQSMQGNPNPNDPRMKELQSRFKEIIQDSVRTGAAFQAVALEGKNLANQSSSH